AVEAQTIVSRARIAVARLLNAADPRQVIFTAHGTDALNLAIHGLLDARGGHVVTTVVEHNSVLRPLRALADAGRITLDVVECDAAGIIAPDAVADAMRDDTRLVAATHASNVTGALQPVAEICAIAHKHGALSLVDAAQTLGEVPIDVEALGVDLLAAPGHKGLLGPLGTGVLYFRRGVERRVDCVRQGGTGSESHSDRQPDDLPQKYESGNLNVPALAGLEAGVSFVLDRGIDAIRAHAISLTAQLREGLHTIEGVTLFGPQSAHRSVGIVSMTLAGCDAHELAAILDGAYRIQARAGLHCAGAMHARLGTLEHGGTLRLSVGPFNTSEDIDATIAAVATIAAETNCRIAITNDKEVASQ
ncbi:MAG TPA: aminotransferase class V-fold PLP-dependent enzyme, partial [Pirellulales bacterium]|nr:aminotransferase class V-fold PLP-dependent enzyme [Pirellulales bacterium]